MPNWEPFSITPTGQRPPPPRALSTRDGVGDRLRAAAFAEIQARDAFLWASERFSDASEDLKQAWRILARAEQKHLDWLLDRMRELGFAVKERAVSDHLWQSFQACETAEAFALFMANAEERGRRAGERFYRELVGSDPITAEIFGKIAEEEITHIELARKFFPESQPGQKP